MIRRSIKPMRTSRRLSLAKLSVWLIGLSFVWCLTGAGARAQSETVRLAAVRTPVDSGLLQELLSDFEKQTGYRVQVQAATQDVFDIARQGMADIVIAHYGFEEVERFVMQGFGLWPRPVFASQSALLGPPGDPANIRGLADAVEGFRRIAETQSPFVVNHDAVVESLIEVLWEGAGRPARGQWYIDQGLTGREAVEAAANLGGYTIWGVDPFLRAQAVWHYKMQALLLNDPLLQRMMVSVVVNPDRIAEVHFKGAQALQQYLLSPAVQAKIRTFRYPDLDQQAWWPAGQHN